MTTYRMLINWRCGAYYPEGSIQDFSKLPSDVPAATQEAIDYAVSQGYMIAVETPAGHLSEDPVTGRSFVVGEVNPESPIPQAEIPTTTKKK